MSNPLSYIEISRRNLLHNLKQFKSKLPKKTKLALVVKANAYGHGLKEIVSIADREADYFQVDDLEELMGIRRYTHKPVLVFGYVPLDQLEMVVKNNGTLGVYNLPTLTKLENIGKKLHQKINIHLKIDSLLGRQGILPQDISSFVTVLKKYRHLNIEAIYSHLSDADSPQGHTHSKKQLVKLLKVRDLINHSLDLNINYHLSASAGFIIDQNHNWGGSILRLGISLYGLWPSDYLQQKYSDSLTLKPVLTWKTKVAQIKTLPKDHPIGYNQTFITKKETRIAIIPQGYSDGYDRGFSNNGEVLITGQRCPILGRVSMNIFVVDISKLKKITLEEEVVLLGHQGNQDITTTDLAKKINTINYEIVARISPLLPRKII